MKASLKIIVTLFMSVFFSSCSADNPTIAENNPIAVEKPTIDVPETTPTNTSPKNIKYLALGDSYTIGQSVCESCRFPEQLKEELKNKLSNNSYSLDIIARTGWTTANLIAAINQQKLNSDYDLVTLLIGVNNQYQGVRFSVYEKEFPDLVQKSIAFAKGDKTRLIVVSIPDYAYTPFGQSYGNPTSISIEIDQYNTFARRYCSDNGIVFIDITNITRNGLNNPKLVANDGLHPSEAAYSLFTEQLLSEAITVLKS